jgi:hypothetical protein
LSSLSPSCGRPFASSSRPPTSRRAMI